MQAKTSVSSKRKLLEQTGSFCFHRVDRLINDFEKLSEKISSNVKNLKDLATTINKRILDRLQQDSDKTDSSILRPWEGELKSVSLMIIGKFHQFNNFYALQVQTKISLISANKMMGLQKLAKTIQDDWDKCLEKMKLDELKDVITSELSAIKYQKEEMTFEKGFYELREDFEIFIKF